MTFRNVRTRFSTVAAVLIAGACGSGMLDVGYPTGVNTAGGASAGTAATYIGAIADSLKHGTISVTVSPSQTVSGLLTFIGGPTVVLTGTVDSAASQIL